MTAVQRWTGAEAKALRQAMRLSVRNFAAHLDIDRRTVNKWEARGNSITLLPDSQGLLDSALRLAGEEVQERFEQAVSQGRDAALRGGESGPEVPAAADLAGLLLANLPAMSKDTAATGSASASDLSAHQLSDYLRTWANDVNRRELIRLLGLAATNLTTPPLLAGLNTDEQERVVHVITGPARVDEQTIRHVEAVLYSAMHQDDVLGPQAALDTVLAQRKLTQTLLDECPTNLRRRLLTLYSNLSRFAGWLSFDLADFETASFYYEQARQAAHEAENTDLSIFVLCNMSHLATWQGRPRVGIDHAIAAQNWAKDTEDPLLRAYAADVAARAYAGARKVAECRQALDQAEAGIVEATVQTPATSLAYFYGPGQVASSRSLCALQLGWTNEAEQAARAALALIGSSFIRNQAFSTIRLGNVHAAAGDVDEAAKVIGDAAVLAARNRSARVLDTLGRGRASLQPWRDRSAVRELDDKLTAYRLLPRSTT